MNSNLKPLIKNEKVLINSHFISTNFGVVKKNMEELINDNSQETLFITVALLLKTYGSNFVQYFRNFFVSILMFGSSCQN